MNSYVNITQLNNHFIMDKIKHTFNRDLLFILQGGKQSNDRIST